MPVGITGASGKLGRLTTDALLDRVDAGDVVLVTRDPATLADAPAEVRRGDFDDPDSLDAAFAGIDRLLLISAEVMGKRVAQHAAAIEAAGRAGVRHVVYTSIVNPTPENPAVAAPDHRQTERMLLERGLEWTFLRNSLYAEYQLPEAVQAIESGRFVHNMGDGAVARVSREDCAAAAAAVLAGAGEAGRAYDITGPAALTAAEHAAVFAELGDRAIEPLALDDSAFVSGLVEQAGIPEPVAQTLASFGTAIREGFLRTVSDDVERLTGRAPRPLREVLEPLVSREALAQSV